MRALLDVLLISYVFIFATLITTPSRLQAKHHHKAVTYDLGGGRFGDKLLGYAHAKWVSYQYGIPLLYKPFIYSDQLVLHRQEFRYTNENGFPRIITPMHGDTIDYSADISALFVIPYFPEAPSEHQDPIHYWIPVDWDDPGFKKELKRLIHPLFVKTTLNLPKDRISVAVHVREGGNSDPDRTTWRNFPLKLPPLSYYIDQIKLIYELLEGRPLYIHLFTDANNPSSIVESFKSHLTGMDLVFGCRSQGNNDTSNVLEDFFEMTRFDCLIRTESNYTIMLTKIADFKLVIRPVREAPNIRHIEEVEVERLLESGHKEKWNVKVEPPKDYLGISF